MVHRSFGSNSPCHKDQNDHSPRFTIIGKSSTTRRIVALVSHLSAVTGRRFPAKIDESSRSLQLFQQLKELDERRAVAWHEPNELPGSSRNTGRDCAAICARGNVRHAAEGICKMALVREA